MTPTPTFARRLVARRVEWHLRPHVNHLPIEGGSLYGAVGGHSGRAPHIGTAFIALLDYDQRLAVGGPDLHKIVLDRSLRTKISGDVSSAGMYLSGIHARPFRCQIREVIAAIILGVQNGQPAVGNVDTGQDHFVPIIVIMRRVGSAMVPFHSHYHLTSRDPGVHHHQPGSHVQQPVRSYYTRNPGWRAPVGQPESAIRHRYNGGEACDKGPSIRTHGTISMRNGSPPRYL